MCVFFWQIDNSLDSIKEDISHFTKNLENGDCKQAIFRFKKILSSLQENEIKCNLKLELKKFELNEPSKKQERKENV